MVTLHADIRRLWDYLGVTEAPRAADAVFAFGGPLLAIPEKAAELYAAGLAPLVLVAGKTGTHDDSGWQEPSAVVFAAHLRERGVPDAAIVVAPESTNTLEDVLLGMPLLLARTGRLESLIAVSRPIHQRRALATVRRAYPAYAYVSCPCDEAPPAPTDPADRLRAIACRALGELDRLRIYAAQGNLEPQTVPDDVSAAAERVAAGLASGGDARRQSR